MPSYFERSGGVILIIPRAGVESIFGILFRHARLAAFVFFLVVFGTFFVVASLRPVFSATALVIVEPATADLIAGGANVLDDGSPSNGTVDGTVELMRSEPVLARAAELLGAFEPGDFSSGWDPRPEFLDFFRIAPEAMLPGEAGRVQALALLRNAVAINRRGLTPVIAITARATTPDFAARVANSVAEAHIALQVAAKADAIRRGKALIEVQLESARIHLRNTDADFSRVLVRLADNLDASSELESAIADLVAQEGRLTQSDPVADLGAGPYATAAHARQTLRQALISHEISGDFRAQLVSLEDETARAQQNYQRLWQRSAELEQLAVLQMPDARLAAPASAPSLASFPDMKTAMAIACLFGLAIALGAAFTLDGFATGVRSTAELAELIGVPTAIAMPRLNMMRFDGTSHADQVITAPLSPFSESMRTLQLGLQRNLLGSAGGQVVFVLSSGDGEGKTTTALGLARAFAAAGRRTLLLDADVRSAALHRHVDVPLGGGFEQVLGGEMGVTRLPSLVRKDPLSSLSVLVNSGRSAVPAETLFGGPTFASVLRGIRASYDVTVVDMPSLTWSAEAAYILPHADAAVVVASWGRTERKKLEEVLAAIRQAHPRPIPLMPVLALMPGALRWPTTRYEAGYSSR